MRDRSPQAAGADHGGDCGSGACAWLLFSLRLYFRLSLRPVPADTAAPGTFEPHGPKMAASRLPLLPPDAGNDDTAASRVRPISAARGSRPDCCC